MFRKKKSTLEISLIRSGVDIHGDLGKCLLSKMIKYGYLDTEIYVDDASKYAGRPLFDICSNFDGSLPAYVRADREDARNWEILVRDLDYQEDGIKIGCWDKDRLHSECDLFGRLVE